LAISQAICDYRKRQGIGGPLFLGIDTHALSVPACASALEVLAANGVEVMLAARLALAGERVRGRLLSVWMAASGRQIRMALSQLCYRRRLPRAWAAIPAKSTVSSRTSSANLFTIVLRPHLLRSKSKYWRNSIGDMLAEKTRHLPHDAYSPTREIMLCHSEPSYSSFWQSRYSGALAGLGAGRSTGPAIYGGGLGLILVVVLILVLLDKL